MRGAVLHGRLGDREGGEQCEYELHRAPPVEGGPRAFPVLPR